MQFCLWYLEPGNKMEAVNWWSSLRAGWRIHDILVMDWFAVDQLPSFLKDILFAEDMVNQSDNEEYYDFGDDESDNDSEGTFDDQF